MKRKVPLLLLVIVVSLFVWMFLGINIQNGEVKIVDTKEEYTATLVIAIILLFACLVIWPLLAYLEMKLLSFLFKKFKSKMTIDDEDEQYRPLQQIDLSEMQNFV